MSKTVDELCDVFGQAAGAEYDRWLHDRRNDPVELAAGLALRMRRAGIAAVIMALRDDIIPERMRLTRANDTCTRSSLRRYFNEILGDAGDEVAGAERVGTPTSAVAQAKTPATDPAPAVCVWEVDGRNLWFARCPKQMGHRSYSQPPSHCPACKAPIKFTEAK